MSVDWKIEKYTAFLSCWDWGSPSGHTTFVMSICFISIGNPKSYCQIKETSISVISFSHNEQGYEPLTSYNWHFMKACHFLYKLQLGNKITKREWKPPIDFYTKSKQARELVSLASAIAHWPPLYSLTKHTRFCKPGVVTFSRCHLLFDCRRTSQKLLGETGGVKFSSVKDVDLIQCNLKSVSIFSHYWLFFG